ncbi:MAG: 5'-nucleotidase [Roseivirga sp.]|jgi:5'-nucleotidase
MKYLRRFLSIAALITFLSYSAHSQTYRILISNDDGIQSPLLKTLSEEIAKLPNVEVIISAPAENQSGSSQSTDGRELTVEKIFNENKFFGYAVSGKPADAVRFGLRVLGKEAPFDLVISGINQGSNVGKLSHLSGTVGAAMEALYHGIPAIAVSQEVRGVNTESSSLFIAQLVTKYQKDGAPKGVVISVNIPAGELKGIAVKPMGDAYLDMGNYTIKSEGENKVVYQQRLAINKSKDPESDTYAYQQGYITVTPLKFDWTAYEMIKPIALWDLVIK